MARSRARWRAMSQMFGSSVLLQVCLLEGVPPTSYIRWSIGAALTGLGASWRGGMQQNPIDTHRLLAYLHRNG